MKMNLQNTIGLPKKEVINLFEAMNIFESAKEEIENFLISRNKEIMVKIKKARKEHLAGKVKDFERLTEKYV